MLLLVLFYSIPVVLPILQFLLFRFPSLHTFSGVLIVGSVLLIPMISRPAKLGAGFYFSPALRLTDLALLDPAIQQSLTFKEYIEYYFTYQIRSGKYPSLVASKNLQKCTLPYEKVTVSFVCKRLLELYVKYHLYWAILHHIGEERPHWNPETMKLVDPTMFKDLFDCYLMGHALCLLLDMLTGGMVFVSLLFKIPYVSVMDSPFFATSMRDFWGNRWNLAVQSALRRIVFDPVMHKLFKHPFPLPRGKVPAWHTMVAGFITFLASGLIHEWAIYITMKEPTTYEQMMYFILQGLLVTLEVSIQRMFKIVGFDIGKWIPYPIAWLYTTLVTTWASPLFLNPYIREKLCYGAFSPENL